MNKLVLAAKVLVTAGLIYLVVSNADTGRLISVVRMADPALALAAGILYALTFVVGGIRWRVISAEFGNASSLGFHVRAFFVSGFFSQIVIGGGYGGDVYRVWALADRSKSKLKALMSVLIDRLSGLMAAILTVAFAAPLYWILFPDDTSILLTISLTCVLIALALLLLASLGRIGADFLRSRSRTVWSERIVEAAFGLATGFLRYPATPIHIAWSIVALSLNMLALFAIGRGVGVDINFTTYFILGPIVFLAKSFPVSVAGWGAREVAMVYFFGMAGVDASNALAMSLLVGVLTLLGSSIGGVLWIARREHVPANVNSN